MSFSSSSLKYSFEYPKVLVPSISPLPWSGLLSKDSENDLLGPSLEFFLLQDCSHLPRNCDWWTSIRSASESAKDEEGFAVLGGEPVDEANPFSEHVQVVGVLECAEVCWAREFV